MRRVLVDTGPLVAILSSADQHHEMCVETLSPVAWPSVFLPASDYGSGVAARAYARTAQQLLKSTDSGFLELLRLAGSEAKDLAEVMKTYQNIQPQLADAALVYLAGLEGNDTIVILDRRDFSVYRSARKQPIHIVPR